MAIERIVPGTIEWDSFYANHINRYLFARDVIIKHDANLVLDAACGVGYGSYFLSELPSRQITAIDRSKKALNIAKSQFQRENIFFLEDDCHTLMAASANGPYDAIVSFETLEHLPDPGAFITACFNNLKQGGQLIISTPNKLVSSPDGKLAWEYHEKEYSFEEFYSILSDHGFTGIQMFGQQFTGIGRLRERVRNELFIIHSNPFMRMGRLIQRLLRGHRVTALLPEQAEDFEIKQYDNAAQLNQLGKTGPFVLLAVCTKL
ncbi:MAG: class I SAM-dependent methyltransferase [Sphingobacteriales bacterium]|nr:MAG: class I SAM-dependent methyltransferase [Sphingobacteriales bacterium]